MCLFVIMQILIRTRAGQASARARGCTGVATVGAQCTIFALGAYAAVRARRVRARVRGREQAHQCLQNVLRARGEPTRAQRPFCNDNAPFPCAKMAGESRRRERGVRKGVKIASSCIVPACSKVAPSGYFGIFEIGTNDPTAPPCQMF